MLDKQTALGSSSTEIPFVPAALTELTRSFIDADAAPRQQVLRIIESLLSELHRERGEVRTTHDERVPLIQCPAPVRAGSDATATLCVVNEDAVSSEVTIYTTNFVADGGFEIPALRVRVAPRIAVVGPREEATFTIQIAIPQQAPPGVYSGLVQAAGHRYVKAVMSMQVL